MSNIIKKKMTTNPRLIKDVLTLYKSTFFALKELIDNSIQAKAKQIEINLIPSTLPQDDVQYHFINTIEIIDNGKGVPLSQVENCLMEIATENKVEGQGIGRFGALQIGKQMTIETVAFDKQINKHTKILLDISIHELSKKNLDCIYFPVTIEELETEQPSYYKVTITDLYSNSLDKIKKKNKLSDEFTSLDSFKQGLFEYYTFNIFEGQIKFIVNGNELKREHFLLEPPKIKKETLLCSDGLEHDIYLHFYKVNLKSTDLSIFFQINNEGVMQSIAKFSYISPWHTPDAGAWYIMVESDLITPEMITDFALADFGNDCKAIQTLIRTCIDDFFKEGNRKYLHFVERLKADKSYPYRQLTNISELEETIFNHTAYIIELNQKLLENSNNARSVIYLMVKKLIEDGNIEFLYSEILKLTDESREKFKDLLITTEMDDVIEFTSSVAHHTQFLDFLHELCYGDISSWLKERKQLHKIVEKQLWLFGEEYNNSTALWSDKKLEKNLEELHKKHFSYNPTEEEENLIEEYKKNNHDITDLFFYNKKNTSYGRSEVMIVELKAPSCAIADKEILQIEKYRKDIINSSAFPREKVTYKIVLISSKLTDGARIKVESSPTWGDLDDPFLYSTYNQNGWNIKLYIMQWSDLIEVNRRKLSYLNESLEVKPEDVGQKFVREYPQLLDEKSRNKLNPRLLK